MNNTKTTEKSQPQNELQEAALQYHNHHLQVLPLRSHRKEPSRSWMEYQYRPQKEHEILNLFQSPDANIGIIGGAVSDNFFALDFDSMQKFNSVRPKIEHLLNNTAVIKTGRGVHVYLKANEPFRKFDKRTLRKKLLIMESAGMIHRDGDIWSAISGVDLDRAVERIGVAGIGERQRAQHKREREAYRIGIEKLKGLKEIE